MLANYNFQQPYINQTSPIRDFHQTHVGFRSYGLKFVFSGPIRQVFGLIFMLTHIRQSTGSGSTAWLRGKTIFLPLIEFALSRVDYMTSMKHIVLSNILCADIDVWISSWRQIFEVTSRKMWDGVGPSDPIFLRVSYVQKDIKNTAIRPGN